jgi:chromosome segregation ATPase
MVKKKLMAIITAGTIILGGTTTAFAANGEFSAIKESIKQNMEVLKSKKGTIHNAVDSKKAELGIKEVDKTALAPQLEALKGLKAELKKIHSDLTVAKESNDEEKVAELKTQLQEKADQISTAAEALAPYKEQREANKELREKAQPLKEQLKTMKGQRVSTWQENKVMRDDIKALKEQLKAAVESNDSEKISSLTNDIIEKLNKINDNLAKLNNLKDEAVRTVNSWQPQ